MLYPNRNSPELQEKMAYFTATMGSHAGEWVCHTQAGTVLSSRILKICISSYSRAVNPDPHGSVFIFPPGSGASVEVHTCTGYRTAIIYLWKQANIRSGHSQHSIRLPHLDLAALPVHQKLAAGIPGVVVLHLGGEQIGGV